MENVNNSINPRAQFFTILKRDSGNTAFIFVWDFMHWLKFNTDGKLKDIRFYGTGRSWEEAHEIINRELPGCKTIIKYCPKSFIWQ